MRFVHAGSGLVVILLSGAGAPLLAQSPVAPSAPGAEAEPGIPVTSETVKKACGACHAQDDKGCLTRISYRRTTPEGWQETVKRMATLNGAPLEPAQAREVVRYLANEQGLAPEEARPAAFEVERRIIDFSSPDKDTQRACGACHSIGRPMLQRRTAEEWDLLVAMHRGYYPLVDFQAFRNPAPPPSEPGPDGKPPDRRHPVEKALAYLKATYPLFTPEWSAWSATRRTPRLAGRFALRVNEVGHEPVFGEATITPKPGAEDEFTTEARYAPAGGGPAVVRRGEALVYTGFQWRGRSSAGHEGDALREVMFVERDGRTISGRWFTGAYDETGLDVTLQRISSEPLVLGVTPPALRAGGPASVRVHGVNLERGLTAKDVDFGPGVRVTRVVSAEGGLAVDLEVAADAPEGARDVFVAGASAPSAAVVFKTVDTLKVTPQAGLARVGGVRFPKGTAQFEARAWSYGRDGKPDTKDDLDLGPVNVAWSLEEFTAVLGDDDLKWAGRIDARGLFTPAEDGPNPKRQGNRNNVGDLWVVATLPTDSPLKPKALLRARAHLIVTVPLYVRWDQAEVAP
jgi:quinohemoprotein amine dehydrogenase